MDSIPSDALQGVQGQGQDDEERAKRAADEQQLRRDLLTQILDTGARERCTSGMPPIWRSTSTGRLMINSISYIIGQSAKSPTD